MYILHHSKLLNALSRDALDERVVNTGTAALSPSKEDLRGIRRALTQQEVLENHSLCLNAAKGLGCGLNSITPAQLAAGKVVSADSEHITMGFLGSR